MTNNRRITTYMHQNGGSSLTARQWRRIAKSNGRKLARKGGNS